MLPTSDDCDDCKPGGVSVKASAAILSCIPFMLTFFLVAYLVFLKLYPFLAGESGSLKASSFARPFSPNGLSQSRPLVKQLSALTFASTVALAAVLALLILCDISNYIDPDARSVALALTISALLILLIVVIPSLEINSIVTATVHKSNGNGNGNGRFRLAWLLRIACFSAWLASFWWSGQYLLGPGADAEASTETTTAQSISEASLRRIGVIGISVMSLLSGFASVSSPWHTFLARSRAVSEETLKRKAMGLQSAQEVLAMKQSRMRNLERKMSEPSTESFFLKAMSSIRGNADSTERQMLLVEIKGLEDMCSSLQSSHSLLQSRCNQQNASKTLHGRLLAWLSRFFSAFCVYRIFTTAASFLRRTLTSRPPPPDPVDNILALLAKHYDPDLDQALWARSISFLLSGIILFASFSSVMQTFHFFSRFMPWLLKTIQANLPLVVAQVCATYVISAALMLRSMVPGGVVGDGLRGLGGGVGRMGWVDGWFEVWFLGGVLITGVGIWVGRQVGGSGGGLAADDDDDDFDEGGAVEMGKMS